MALNVVALVLGGWMCGVQPPAEVPPPSRDAVVPLPEFSGAGGVPVPPAAAPFCLADFLPLAYRCPPVARALKNSALVFRCLTGTVDQEDVESLLGKPSIAFSIGPYRLLHFPRLRVYLAFNDNGYLRHVESLWLQRPETLPKALRGDLLGLQGYWILVATEQGGKRVAEPDVSGSSGVVALIEGNHLVLGPALALPCRFRLARSGATGTFSLLSPGHGAEKEWRQLQTAAPTKGVYRLAGDQLQVQFCDRGDPPRFDMNTRKYPILHFKKRTAK